MNVTGTVMSVVGSLIARAASAANRASFERATHFVTESAETNSTRSPSMAPPFGMLKCHPSASHSTVALNGLPFSSSSETSASGIVYSPALFVFAETLFLVVTVIFAPEMGMPPASQARPRRVKVGGALPRPHTGPAARTQKEKTMKRRVEERARIGTEG